MEPCISWAKSRGYPLPTRPSMIEFFLVEGRYYWAFFPFGLIVLFLPITQNIRFYKSEMSALLDKWEKAGRPDYSSFS